MTDYLLQFKRNHLFVETEDGLWLLDTGAPTSFGLATSISFSGEMFQIDSDYIGMDIHQLSRFVGVDCVGLLGVDIMGGFDLVFDVPNAVAHVSADQLSCSGNPVVLDAFMGIPIVEVNICGKICRAFFDTGAQISYFTNELLRSFPEAGRATDFYPGIGEFEVDTYTVEVILGENHFHLCCGSLPTMLAANLMMAGTQGIISNHITIDREVGYFPRRQILVL